MIVKSFEEGDRRFLITQNLDGTFNAIKLIKGEEPEYHSSKLDFDSASIIFNVWLNEEPMYDIYEDNCND